MARVKRVVLDVLKPHHPNALEFAKTLAALGAGYDVALTVDEVDDKTESVIVIVTGEDIQFEAIEETITTMGGSVHSIDEVQATGAGPDD